MNINQKKPVVTVIVPVYNAEHTLHIAMDSILAQIYPDLEIIIINDCSTDKSQELIQHYAAQLRVKPNVQVKVLSHKQNEGVAAARNTGLDHATGEYIYYVDADDWLETDAIELTVDQAISTGADIIGFNWWLSFELNERKMNQPEFSTPWQAIEWMLLGKMRWNLWLFLVKRDLYTAHAICFTPGRNMGEDMMVMMKLFTCAGKVTYLNKAFYHYGQSNTGSLTKVYSERHVEEVTKNVQETERFLLNSRFADQSAEFIDYLKLNIKLPLLISNRETQFAYWRSWFPEANRLAMSDKNTSLRIRLLQGAAANKLDWIVKLHYYLVIRLVYGVIYK
jgi:glycosyltransferase involved in cell wall biosynthesis